MSIGVELTYLLARHFGDIQTAVPAIDGREGAGKARKIDAWTAFAMISGWREYEVIPVEPKAEGMPDKPGEWPFGSEPVWTYHVEVIEDDWPTIPKILFSAPLSLEQASEEVGMLEAHYRASMTPEQLAGMDLFDRLRTIIANKERFEQSLRHEEGQRAASAERARSKQLRAAERKDPSSVFGRAEKSARSGRDFKLVRFSMYSGRETGFASSMKKALSILGDPKTVIHTFVEEKRVRDDGLVEVWFEYSDRAKHPDDPTHRIEFLAPPGERQAADAKREEASRGESATAESEASA